MQVILAHHYTAETARLRGLLGDGFQVRPMAQLPDHGEITADVLVTSRLDAGEARRLRVRLLQAPSAGLDGIARHALPADCRVCNVHGHEGPIAEYVIHALLGHYLADAAASWPLDAEHWADAYRHRARHQEIAGKTLLLLGFGRIGQAIATRAQALGMTVVAVARHRRAASSGPRVVPFDALQTVLPEADAVVLCCPLDASTRGCIGRGEIDAMKRSAVLVNVARAEVVDEDALYEALQARRIAAAVLDVWYAYPKTEGERIAPSRRPFHALPNVRCTPHVSGWTDGLVQRRYELIAQNIHRLRDGLALLGAVG